MKALSGLKFEMRATDLLIPYELNAKKHDPDQVSRIAASISNFGWDQPIVVDRYGVIIKGHGRRLAAISLGLKEVPVLVRDDMTPDQVKASRLADNRAGLSDIDPELMRLALAELDTSLLTSIFDTKELEFMDVDLGSMNAGAFVDDMGAVVEAQKNDVADSMAKIAVARTPLAKAFGFKDIDASDQIHITTLMARAEAATGLTEAPALIAFFAAAK